MKGFQYYIKIIVSILLILVSIYIFINVYLIFSNVNGQLYDGFGDKYANGSPNSKYTLIGYICFITGISTLIETNSKHRKKEILEEIQKKG